MKLSAVIITTSAALVAAAPVEQANKRELNLGGAPGASLINGAGPAGQGAAGAGQDAVAGLFGAADAVLNTPIDIISSLLSGDVSGLLGNLPGAGAATKTSSKGQQ